MALIGGHYEEWAAAPKWWRQGTHTNPIMVIFVATFTTQAEAHTEPSSI
jgi:hypothetical protein